MPMLKTIRDFFACCMLILATCLFFSCATQKKYTYFQSVIKDTTILQAAARNFSLPVKPDDLLTITVSSASPELSALYNAQGAGTSGTTGTGGYLVDKNGNIQLYKLGNVNVGGLTRDAVKDKLEKDLSPYLKDPVVTVRFANHRITVLGEVSSPGVVAMPNEQISVLEAIGQSGDLTDIGRPENILVIRQTPAGKEFRRLNLLDHSIFSSPYFYLQNEDVVYVEPDPKRKDPPKTQQTISYIISGISIVTLLLSRIR